MSRRELVVVVDPPVSNEKEDAEPAIMADRRTSDSLDMVEIDLGSAMAIWCRYPKIVSDAVIYVE